MMDAETDQKYYNRIVLGAIAIGGTGAIIVAVSFVATWISTGEFPLDVLHSFFNSHGQMDGTR